MAPTGLPPCAPPMRPGRDAGAARPPLFEAVSVIGEQPGACANISPVATSLTRQEALEALLAMGA